MNEGSKKALNNADENSINSLTNLPPEVEEGNIEYKLKLINPSEYRIEHLVTQMKWRLEEGLGEAIYKIGVEDNGTCAGLTSDELKSTMSTLQQMADRLGANLTVLRKREVTGEDEEEVKQVAEILVRRVPDDQQFLDIRLSVLGSADSGKSTLLGVLCHGQMDDGQGQSRLNLFRHLHEVQTGRTSSISHEIMGFDSKGNVVNYSENRSPEEICRRSSKIMTFIDLAGHQKYLKTTIFGLTSNQPDFTMLVVNADRGITLTTREHLGYALALNVPTIAVITKIDICSPEKVNRTCKNLKKLLTSVTCGRIPFKVESEDDAYTAASGMSGASNIIPFFTTSSVTGENIDLLTNFLNVLPPRKNAGEQKQLMQKPVKFQIDEVYSVPEVGIVVGGNLSHGSISEHDQLLIGPSCDGCYRSVTVTTIQRNRTPCRIVCAGQGASLSLENVDKESVRKGMVLVSESLKPTCCLRFTATIFLLYHPASHLSEGFQATVHVGNVRQTAIIEEIHNDAKQIGVNEQASATFCFVCHPEHLETASTLLFREQTTNGMGQITNIYPFNASEDTTPAGTKRRMRRSRTISSNTKPATAVTATTAAADSSNRSDGASEPASPKRQFIER